jgi:predicted RNA binding protein YcfA (HicA-like mRNA interferase family)
MISLTNLTQKKWSKACKKLNLIVDKKKGKGSHYRIINPKTNQATTLPSHCHKYISIEIYRTLLEWGISEESLDKALS